MVKQITVTLLLTLSVIGALGYTKYRQIMEAIASGMARQMPPEAVTTFTAEEKEWQVSFSAVGTVAAVQGAVIASEDIGRVSKVVFEPGQLVKQGQLLIELDTSVEEAELAGALAQLDLARATAKRERALRDTNANSAAQVDTAEATLRVAEANVLKLRAQIARKKIVAPFTGRTGVKLVNEGQVVIPSSQLVSLQSFDPVYVNFSLPQQNVASLSTGLEVSVKSDSYPDRVMKGTITTIQPEINSISRMLQLQATVQNPGELLRPGMFVGVSVDLPLRNKVIQIPTSSILYAPYGDSVFVVENMKNPTGQDYLGVKRITVTLGEQRGDMVAINSGVSAGAQVVSSGVFKLHPGAAVEINNSVQPKNEISPQPEDK